MLDIIRDTLSKPVEYIYDDDCTSLLKTGFDTLSKPVEYIYHDDCTNLLKTMQGE